MKSYYKIKIEIFCCSPFEFPQQLKDWEEKENSKLKGSFISVKDVKIICDAIRTFHYVFYKIKSHRCDCEC